MGRFAGCAVKRIHRQAGSWVTGFAGDFVAGMFTSAHSVFRAIERHQIHTGGICQYIYGAHQVAVHTAGIGHKAHPFPLQRSKVLLYEHLQACFYHSSRLLLIKKALLLAPGAATGKDCQGN